MFDLTGLPVPTDEEVQQDALQSCYNLCKEGADTFKSISASASLACLECAANIYRLAEEHGHNLIK